MNKIMAKEYLFQAIFFNIGSLLLLLGEVISEVFCFIVSR